MTDTTPTDPTADERERMALIIARCHPGWNDDTSEPDLPLGPMRDAAEAHWIRVNEECLKSGVQYVDALLAAGFGDVSAWRERAEQAECGLAEARKLLVTRVEASRLDALRARIEAAQAVFDAADVLDEVALSMRAALAGDQPAPEPTGCDCEPREATLDADLNTICAECGALLSTPPPRDAEPAGDSTPEPPHLDPKPWTCRCGGGGVVRATRESRHFHYFEPRPVDENGKPYSQNRASYGVA